MRDLGEAVGVNFRKVERVFVVSTVFQFGDGGGDRADPAGWPL